ncbi:MAG: efflux RND transporter permease subunit [Psychrilyobacter sp.]|nr:efflux RND transporter permease subunit [Psychrilyobacter sp.]
MSLSSMSIKRPVAVILMMVTLVMAGVMGLKKMPVDLMPNMNIPVVLVSTTWIGATPEDIDNMITKKIEDAMANVEAVKKMTSTSSENNSGVVLEFDYGVDVDKKVSEVETQLNNIRNDLPTDAKTPMVFKAKAGSTTIISVNVLSDDLVLAKSLAENRIKTRFQQIKGVGSVNVFGGYEKEVKVEVNPNKIEAYGMNIDDVYNILRTSSSNIPAGSIEEGEKKYLIRVMTELKTVEDIKNIIISNEGGKVLYLKDVANISLGNKDVESYSRIDGVDSISISVEKASDGNSIIIADGVKDAIKDLERSLPSKIKLLVTHDTSKDISNSISSVVNSAITGLILATIVLFLFLRDIRATMIIAMAIPLSIMGSFFFLNIVGVGINIISLMGLSLGVGMLVDNGVVVLDNIYRHMTELKKPIYEASKDGASEMMIPILASTATTVAVFLPLIINEGIAKEIFYGMSWAVTFSLISSLLVAMTFVPMISSKLLKLKTEESVDGKLFSKVKDQYLKLLEKTLNNKKKTLLIIVIMFFVIVIPAALTTGGGFIPPSDDGVYVVTGETPAGLTIDKINELARNVEAILKADKYTNSIETSVDSNGFAVNVRIGNKADRDKNVFEITDMIRDKVGNVPDVDINVADGFAKGPGGSEKDIVLDLVSSNIGQLEVFTQQLYVELQKMPDLGDFSSGLTGGNPQGQIVVDREKARYFGVRPSEINKIISYEVLGATPIELKTDLEEIDVNVMLPQEYKKSLSKLMGSKLKTESGAIIELSDVAHLEIIEGPAEKLKLNRIEKINISANVRSGKNAQLVINMIKEKIEKIGIPDGIVYSFGGENEMQTEVMGELSEALMIAVFLIFVILASQFESLILPLIIMGSVPLSIMGVYAGLMITRTSFDIMVMVGIVMLSGIVVNNALVLIDYTKLLIARGHTRRAAVLEAGRTRIRPILMTSLTTMLGMVPLALGIGQGSEMYQGMAIAVIFGLLASTLLTLIVIPILFEGVENKIERSKEKRAIKKEKKEAKKIKNMEEK